MSTFVNFADLNNWGLIDEINNKILHPVGLRLLLREDGTSPGAVISKQLTFEVDKEKNYRYEDFLKNRYYELTRRLQSN